MLSIHYHCFIAFIQLMVIFLDTLVRVLILLKPYSLETTLLVLRTCCPTVNKWVIDNRLCHRNKQSHAAGSPTRPYLVNLTKRHIRNQFALILLILTMPSVLWLCWLGVRKSIWPVKIWVMRCWHGYLLEQSANSLHMVQLMSLPPHHLCFSKIQNGLSFWYRLTRVVPDKES